MAGWWTANIAIFNVIAHNLGQIYGFILDTKCFLLFP